MQNKELYYLNGKNVYIDKNKLWNLNRLQKCILNAKFYLYSKLRDTFYDIKPIYNYFDEKLKIIIVFQREYIRNNKAIVDVMPWNNQRKHTDRVTEFLRDDQAVKEFNETFR